MNAMPCHPRLSVQTAHPGIGRQALLESVSTPQTAPLKALPWRATLKPLPVILLTLVLRAATEARAASQQATGVSSYIYLRKKTLKRSMVLLASGSASFRVQTMLSGLDNFPSFQLYLSCRTYLKF